MRLKKTAALLVALAPLFAFFSACGGGRAELPASWIWDKDQTAIEPGRGSRSAWVGWTVRGGEFIAESAIAKFILWTKTTGPRKLHVTYALEGQPALFIVNGRLRRGSSIEPSLHFRTAVIEAELRAGINLLEFRGPGNGRLRVRRITVDVPEPRPARDLEAGDSVTLFLARGRGRMQWRGSGELEVRKKEGLSGEFRETVSTHKTRLLLPTVRLDLDFAGPGTLTVKAVKGRFDAAGFSFDEDRPAPPPPRRLLAKDPPVFIFLTDACQASHLSIYGYPRPTSPHMAALAADAVVFENAYATASYTRSSVRSLLTGEFPERSAVGNLTRVSDRLPTIPEYLKTKGYRTSIFTSAVTISPAFGFTKGVDDYHQYLSGQEDKSRARRIDLDEFGRWLESPGPLFSYVHFIEPHLPILPPPPFLDMFSGATGRRAGGERLMSLMERATALRRPFTPAEVEEVVADYDSTIAYVDSEIGRAVGMVKEAGLYDDALIVILSDHGEAMYEHKAWGHSRNVFEETTHVPLLVKFPAALGLKGRVARIVQPIDIFPTLADLFGQRLPLPGGSLLAAAPGSTLDDACAVSQSVAEMGQFGVRWRHWYYIVSLNTGRQMIFDLDADPRKELRSGDEDLKRFFLAMFLDGRTRRGGSAEASAAIDLKSLTPAELESLKTLGYI